MDPKELRGLYEAYSEVYAPREEEIEEDLRPLPKEKMARQAQKAQGMENRAAAAGDEKETNRQMQRRFAMQMPSSRRTVLDKKKMGEEVEIEEAVKGESSERRKDLATERRVGHRPLSKKEGERYASHKLSQMAYVKRKRMGEELEIFDVVLEFLYVEGYAETLEEAEWMMANVIDEEAIEIILGEEQLDELSHDTYRSVAKKQNQKVGALQDAGKDDTEAQNRLDRTKRLRKKSFVEPKAPGARNPYAEEYMDEAEIMKFQKEKGNIEARMDSNKRRKSKTSAYYTAPTKGSHGADYRRRHNIAPTKLRSGSLPEEYMDEAEEARNNPEKYEAGEKKKYAPVRGERTPMPPRGDKRREDFEKWYAANVR